MSVQHMGKYRMTPIWHLNLKTKTNVIETVIFTHLALYAYQLDNISNWLHILVLWYFSPSGWRSVCNRTWHLWIVTIILDKPFNSLEFVCVYDKWIPTRVSMTVCLSVCLIWFILFYLHFGHVFLWFWVGLLVALSLQWCNCVFVYFLIFGVEVGLASQVFFYSQAAITTSQKT